MSHTIKLVNYAPEKDEYLHLEAESFGEAVVCNGHVALRETREITISDAPGQCWGEYIHAKAGDCRLDENRRLECREMYCIDDTGVSIDLVTLESLEPFRLSFRHYTGVAPLPYGEEPKKHQYENIATPGWRLIPDGSGDIEITGISGNLSVILIPGFLYGRRVRKADLSHCSLEYCRTLIVDSSVEELAIGFENARRLSRIEIADSTAFSLTPNNLDKTPWFSSQPTGQVYLAGWYCGCNDDSHYRESELRIREGTVGIAGHADNYSCWKSIIMPDSVVGIGPWAFTNMPALENLKLSESLINMEKYVFFDCPRLSELYLPHSLIGMGDAVFSLAMGLKNVSMPKHLFSRDPYFFSWTPYITLREGDKCELIYRVCEAHRINGRVTVYKHGKGYKIDGKNYRSFNQLCHNPLGVDSNDYLDIYGNFVRHVAEYDYSRMENGDYGYYQGEAWYVVTKNGLCMLRLTNYGNDKLVHEYMQPDDIPPRHSEKVLPLFHKLNAHEN